MMIQTPATDDLLQRFSLDLGDAPCLAREEEYALARQARDAWQALLHHLQTQPHCPPIGEQPAKRRALPEQWSEPDVLALLAGIDEHTASPPSHAEGEKHHRARRQWLTHARTLIEQFRLARNELVRRNLRLVLFLVRRRQGKGPYSLDFIQEGVLGLMRAVEKFDPDRGVKFSTYAVWWIRQAIARGVTSARGAGVPDGRHPAPEHPQLPLPRREGQAGESSPPPFPRATGEQPGASSPAVRFVSLDAPVAAADGRPLSDFLVAPALSSPEEVLLSADRTRTLRQTLTRLAPADAAVVRLRFGLADGHTYTLEEVGQQLTMSYEQVRRREERALLQLKRLYRDIDRRTP